MDNILVVIEDYESVAVTSPIVARALELASALSSKVWLLHIVPHTGQAPFNVDSKTFRKEITRELRHEHEALHRLAEHLREQGVETTALLVQGAVIKTILRESERLNTDLIILGCHRHGLLFGALTEVTEEGLLGKCPRPILFVPVEG